MIGVRLAHFLYRNKVQIQFIVTKDETLKKHFRKTPVIHYKDLEPEKLKNIDLGVVAVFSILPKEIFNAPKFGMLNLHYSLLPSYGGPIPLFWQIANKEKLTGASVHFISEKIDKGKLIAQKSTPLIYNMVKMEKILQPIGEKLMLNAIYSVKKYGRNVPELQVKWAPSYYGYFSKK